MMLSPRLEQFLRALDAEVRFEHVRPSLDLIGAAAIEVTVGHPRGTKDCDVLEAWGREADVVRGELERSAGKGTPLARRMDLYVDVVANGFPLLPRPPEWIPVLQLQRFDVRALAPADVAVSKLKRFAPRDREDIDALVEHGHITHERFVQRFLLALEWLVLETDVEEFRKIRARFHEVESEIFAVRTLTVIEVPTWLDED